MFNEMKKKMYRLGESKSKKKYKTKNLTIKYKSSIFIGTQYGMNRKMSEKQKHDIPIKCTF